MARKNIFDILESKGKVNYVAEYKSIENLLRTKINFTCVYYLLEKYFLQWEYRDTCINVDSLKIRLNIDEVDTKEKYLLYCECIYNLLYHTGKLIDNDESRYCGNIVVAVAENIGKSLEKIGYQMYKVSDENKFIVVQKDYKVIEATNYVNEDIAYTLMVYNKYDLKGNVEEKKKVLIKLATWHEKEKDNLEKIDKSLSKDIGFLFNNLNIRHNNVDKNSDFYKKVKSDIEQWYDRLYTLIVIAILTIEKEKISKQVKELKSTTKEK